MPERFCPTCGTRLEPTSRVNFGEFYYYKCSKENRFWMESHVSMSGSFSKEIRISEATGPGIGSETDLAEFEQRQAARIANN